MQNEIKLKAAIPAAFAAACQAARMEPQQALQTFLDHLIVYSQLASPGDDSYSLAGSVLRDFLDRRRMTPAPNQRTRAANIEYMQQLIALISSRMSAAEKDKAYHALIDQWHAALH
jgi:hypothetical protein